MKINLLALLLMSVFFTSCKNQDPNIDETGMDQLVSHELDHRIDKNEMDYQELMYVPIYSDIYVDAQNPNCLLSATLSIRNTSYEDSIFISRIEYFNTSGELVKNYIENPISIPPMATVNYVVERDDDTGGHGANFIVALSAKNNAAKPIIQAVMIGQYSNKGISFVTDGYSINK